MRETSWVAFFLCNFEKGVSGSAVFVIGGVKYSIGSCL